MTPKAQNEEATANLLTKLAMVITDSFAHIGLMPPLAKIHNESGKTIFLIPISCGSSTDLKSTGKIEDRLAKIIRKSNIELVDWRQYDQSLKLFSTKIHILFRVGSETDNLERFLGHMRTTCTNGIKLFKGEQLYSHDDLCQERDLYLKLEQGMVRLKINAGQDGDKDKGQQAAQTPEPPVTKTQVSSSQDLIKEVEALRKEVDALEEQMAAVMNFLQKIKSESKCSSSPNTASASNRS